MKSIRPLLVATDFGDAGAPYTHHLSDELFACTADQRQLDRSFATAILHIWFCISGAALHAAVCCT
jgi:hypothetical protein